MSSPAAAATGGAGAGSPPALPLQAAVDDAGYPHPLPLPPPDPAGQHTHGFAPQDTGGGGDAAVGEGAHEGLLGVHLPGLEAGGGAGDDGQQQQQQAGGGGLLDPQLARLAPAGEQADSLPPPLEDGQQQAADAAAAAGTKGKKRPAKDGGAADGGAHVPKPSLTAGDWMRVFAFMDEHPGLSQLKTVQAFAAMENGEALLFNQATLSRTLKKRADIAKLYGASAQGPLLKRARKVKHPEVEEALLGWIRARADDGKPPSGKEIKARVLELQHEQGVPEGEGLKGTNGWLESFITTHDIALPPTASSEAKRLKRESGGEILYRVRARAQGRRSQSLAASNAHQDSPATQHHLGASSQQQQQQQQQGLDSAAAQHLSGLDSYLQADDLGGPSSFTLHGHEGDGGMMDGLGDYVLGLEAAGPQQDLHVQSGEGEGEGGGGGGGGGGNSVGLSLVGDDGSRREGEDSIDPAFHSSLAGGTAADHHHEQHHHQHHHSHFQHQQQQQQQQQQRSVYETHVAHVDGLQALLTADLGQLQLQAAGPAAAAAADDVGRVDDILRHLDLLRAHLAAHHQHH